MGRRKMGQRLELARRPLHAAALAVPWAPAGGIEGSDFQRLRHLPNVKLRTVLTKALVDWEKDLPGA